MSDIHILVMSSMFSASYEWLNRELDILEKSLSEHQRTQVDLSGLKALRNEMRMQMALLTVMHLETRRKLAAELTEPPSNEFSIWLQQVMSNSTELD